MKTFKFTFIIWALLVAQPIMADVIPDDSHYVEKCVKITNIDDFENLILLGYVKYVGAEHETTYKISSSECLTKGYKFNTLEIYAVHNNNIDGLDINIIDLPNKEYALKSNITIEPYAGYFSNSDPTLGIQEFYKIIGFTENEVILYLNKKVTTYNNGNPDLVEEFLYSGNADLLSQQMPLDIQTNLLNSGLTIYPNPPVDKLYIKAKKELNSLKVNVYNITGKKMLSETLSKTSSEDKFCLGLVNLEKGIYLIEFNFDTAIETRKIVIK
jgi:hypothetical protein